jgi:acyl-coenzyme A thioesterase PaaI-like protein
MPSMDHRIAVEPGDQPSGISSRLARFEWISAQAGFVEGGIRVERRHLVPTGFLDAAAVVALAASACVSRTVSSHNIRDFLPEAGLTPTA